MKTPLTKAKLRQHFTYCWWRYVLLAVVVIFGWNILFTMTAYRSPEDKKVEVYVYGSADQTAFDALLTELHEKLLPDMEVVDSVLMVPDETYGAVQLTTYIYAGEGDLYILPKDEFQSYASQGAFLQLEDNEELMALCEELGIDLTRGWRRNSDTGERHLYGIPVDELPGLSDYLYLESGSCIGVMIKGGNLENSEILLEGLIRVGAANQSDTVPETEPTEAVQGESAQ